MKTLIERIKRISELNLFPEEKEKEYNSLREEIKILPNKRIKEKYFADLNFYYNQK